MYNKDYSVVCGITYNRVVDLIPYFDILDTDFIHYMSDYWLKDKALSCPKFNEEVLVSCRKFFYKVYYPTMDINNGKYIAYSINRGEQLVHFIVIGRVEDNKYYEILKLFRTAEDEITYNKLKEYYENV